MRSILSFVFVCGSCFVLGCGGSNEPPKQPSSSEMATTQTSANTPMSPSSPDTAPMAAESTPAAPPPPAATTATATPAAPTLSDAEIVAITSAANNGEIEQAKIAAKSAQNAQVKTFANMMLKEHGEAEAKGKKIAQSAKISPADSELSTKLRSESESTLASLKNQKGADLDRAYMDAQVKAHKDVLSAIDDKLLPNAKNADLKAHLSEVRQHVSMHLSKAQEISASLNGAASTPATKK